MGTNALPELRETETTTSMIDRDAQANAHILSTWPRLKGILKEAGETTVPMPGTTALSLAVPRIVVGQMLSGHVSDVINHRITATMEAQGYDYAWLVSENDLRAAGLSNRKIRTIKEFGERYSSPIESLESIWPSLSFEELLVEVKSIWGLGDWSAAMLAIFHFGQADIFPYTDGSLTRAVKEINARYYCAGEKFDPELSRPFRTYLSLYLWKILDKGILRSN